jgi:hypothetical protein
MKPVISASFISVFGALGRFNLFGTVLDVMAQVKTDAESRPFMNNKGLPMDTMIVRKGGTTAWTP